MKFNNKIITLNIIKKNFLCFDNKEDIFLYLIKLSKFSPKIPSIYYKKKFLVEECQNNVWLFCNKKKIINKKYLIIYFDSDSLIIKGIIFIIFLFYQFKSINKLINYDILLFFKEIKLFNYLSFLRQNGILNIIKIIKKNI